MPNMRLGIRVGEAGYLIMSKIGDKLSSNPSQHFEFDHNGQIKGLMVELGIAEKFQKFPEGTGPRVQSAMIGEHTTHFILIVLHSGYETENQNGYEAWCLPKSKFSINQFHEFCQRVLNPTDDRIISTEVGWGKPGNPSN
jgi:hypothetical protein